MTYWTYKKHFRIYFLTLADFPAKKGALFGAPFRLS